MEAYFVHVVNSLNVEDMSLLSILQHHEATSRIKAIKNQTLFDKSGLTEAKYRKVMDRLLALSFIVPVKDFKEHLLFISDYGMHALGHVLQSLEER